MNQPDSTEALQRWLQEAILSSSADAGAVVQASRRMTAGQHLAIYRRSYAARLRECMQQQFSALAFALGPDLFRAFADEYLQVYPSQSYTLNELGRRFPAFLESTRPDADAAEREWWPDFMIELAEFEFALQEVFDAPVVEAGPALVDPQLKLFRHAFPVCAYYLAFCRKEEPELPLPEPSFAAVTRLDLRLQIVPLAADEHHFLQALQDKVPLQTARFVLGNEARRQEEVLHRLARLGLLQPVPEPAM
ncbi:MAG: DUF2063 domain-containing protein [Chitinophagaceae bacterium]|nr:MAG: DUF2063 domain-containing protein [Chitinophagaceae bacterium]